MQKLKTIALFLLISSFALAAEYRVEDLGTLGGEWSSATGINNAGQVIGAAKTESDVDAHAFIFEAGKLQDMALRNSSYPRAINDDGDVVGDFNNVQSTAFVYLKKEFIEIGPFPGKAKTSLGLAINNNGQVTGMFYRFVGTHAYLYEKGAVKDLGTLGGTSSVGYGINNSGNITGEAEPLQGQAHAFLFKDGAMKDLGTLGGAYSVGRAINDKDQITGSAKTKEDGNHSQIFLYENGKMRGLGKIGVESFGTSINNRGQIVGEYKVKIGDDGYESHPLFYDSTHGLVDVNSLIDPASGWVLDTAAGINDQGQIVGTGKLHGKTRAFLLTLVE